jgi:four helix bundle protein
MGKSIKKKYDLEERTFLFAKEIRAFIKKLPKTLSNIDDIKQLVRASGSQGANYIEANESLSTKDFIFRIKICRKEVKECSYWLRLIDLHQEDELIAKRELLLKEAKELTNIFGAILRNTKKKIDFDNS